MILGSAQHSNIPASDACNYYRSALSKKLHQAPRLEKIESGRFSRQQAKSHRIQPMGFQTRFRWIRIKNGRQSFFWRFPKLFYGLWTVFAWNGWSSPETELSWAGILSLIWSRYMVTSQFSTAPAAARFLMSFWQKKWRIPLGNFHCHGSSSDAASFNRISSAVARMMQKKKIWLSFTLTNVL